MRRARIAAAVMPPLRSVAPTYIRTKEEAENRLAASSRGVIRISLYPHLTNAPLARSRGATLVRRLFSHPSAPDRVAVERFSCASTCMRWQLGVTSQC